MKLVKSRRKRKKRISTLVLTSDIAFLLLIFLVVTANLEYSPEITPPKIVNTKDFLAADVRVILIEITGDGTLFLESKKIEFSGFESSLNKMNDDFIFKIYAYQTVTFYLVASVLQTLQKNNKQKILMMIEKDIK